MHRSLKKYTSLPNFLPTIPTSNTTITLFQAALYDLSFISFRNLETPKSEVKGPCIHLKSGPTGFHSILFGVY